MLSGCATRSAPTTTPLGLVPEDDGPVVQLVAPAAFCDAEPSTPPPTPIDYADVPPAVTVAPDGSINLDAAGVPAGLLLRRIGEASRVVVEVDGWGAYVPIYAHVEGMSFDALIERIAVAAGLRVLPGWGMVRVVDVRDAIRIDRGRELQLATEPLELRTYPVDHPTSLGRVVAQTVLSCRGRVVASEERKELLIIDTPSTLDEIEQLVTALTGGGDFARTWTTGARARAGVADPPARLCPVQPRPAGTSAGEWLVSIAQRDHIDVVVGCGAQRGTGPLPDAPDIQSAARNLWFSEVTDDVYVGPAMAAAIDRFALLEPPAWRVETVQASQPVQAAGQMTARYGTKVTAVAFEPRGAVVVGGTPEDIEGARATVEAAQAPEWSQDDTVDPVSAGE